MPVAFDLEFNVVGDLRGEPGGELSIAMRTDIAARIKWIVIGELTEGHKPHGFSDPALTLPGHIALHRMFVQRVERKSARILSVSVRLHVLSDRVDRCQQVVLRLNGLKLSGERLPRTQSTLTLNSWKVVAGETWNTILNHTVPALRSDPLTEVAILTLHSPALRRSRQMGWKVPDTASLLDAAGWNLVRLLAAGEQWVTVEDPQLPMDRIEQLVTIDEELSRPVQVDATSFASAAVKEAAPGVVGLTGGIALRLPVDDAKHATAMAWVRAFTWTGVGGYGTAGCGHISLAFAD
jgi:hypothetical protein